MGYVMIIVGHRSFWSGKTVIVGVPRVSGALITDYRDKAFPIACDAAGVHPEDSSILSWQYLGPCVFVNCSGDPHG